MYRRGKIQSRYLMATIWLQRYLGERKVGHRGHFSYFHLEGYYCPELFNNNIYNIIPKPSWFATYTFGFGKLNGHIWLLLLLFFIIESTTSIVRKYAEKWKDFVTKRKSFFHQLLDFSYGSNAKLWHKKIELSDENIPLFD